MGKLICEVWVKVTVTDKYDGTIFTGRKALT